MELAAGGLVLLVGAGAPVARASCGAGYRVAVVFTGAEPGAHEADSAKWHASGVPAL